MLGLHPETECGGVGSREREAETFVGCPPLLGLLSQTKQSTPTAALTCWHSYSLTPTADEEPRGSEPPDPREGGSDPVSARPRRLTSPGP